MSPLVEDLSTLPRAAGESNGSGLRPDAEPRFVQTLVESWAQDEIDNPYTPSTNARFWHSDAGKCARLISYKAAKIPASDPIELSGLNNVRIGSILHETWQQAALAKFGDKAEAEVRVRTLDGDGTGKIDLVVRDDITTDIELKTIGGFGYKAAIGKAARGRPAEGPKSEHLLQGSINGLANDADEVVIAYLAKEAVSVNQSSGITEIARFAAEWTFNRAQFLSLANEELDRVGNILVLLDEGSVAARKIPDLGKGPEIVDVAKGRWEHHVDGALVDTGSYWGCGYCSHRTLCAKTDGGRQPLESIVAISTKAVA